MSEVDSECWKSGSQGERRWGMVVDKDESFEIYKPPQSGWKNWQWIAYQRRWGSERSERKMVNGDGKDASARTESLCIHLNASQS